MVCLRQAKVATSWVSCSVHALDDVSTCSLVLQLCGWRANFGTLFPTNNTGRCSLCLSPRSSPKDPTHGDMQAHGTVVGANVHVCTEKRIPTLGQTGKTRCF